LPQGTLYPDVIESVSFTGGPSGTIQEPPQRRGLARADEHGARSSRLRELFKDEVRALGRELACPRAFVWPPSVPALASPSASPGEVTRERLRHPAQSGRDLPRGNPRRRGCTDAIWQAFAVLLPVKGLSGVMGDYRTYDNVLRIARGHFDRMHDRPTSYSYDAAFLSRVATRYRQRG
jgi:GMP synthase (glutamine-hydrolysing)